MTDSLNSPIYRRIHLSMVVFENLLPPEDLPRFRGAVIAMTGGDRLFHNHVDAGYSYRYPRIQYKQFDGHPAILGIEEGADILKKNFTSGQGIRCRIGNREELLKVSSVGDWHEETGISNEIHSYAIENWLPLNERNFREYQGADGIIERLSILQRVLVGNILSFAKGMDMYFSQEIKCTIQQISTNGPLTYKGIDLLGFSASFRSNVKLPQWIGLGKSASQNHGIIIHL